MELRQLQSFLLIAQVKSFSKAAQILGYSQSAMTVQIRLLENELNVRLFDRMGKRIALTSYGYQFLTYANNITQEMHKAMHLAAQKEELHAPLHIGVIESLCTSKLPPILNYFRQNYPKVPISITTNSPQALIEMMENNQLDLIYILDRPRYHNSWNKVMEQKESIVFVSSPSFHMAGQKDIHLEELISEPFFLTEKNENYRRELDQFLEATELTLTPFLESSNTAFIIQMLLQNRGISLLPYFAVQESIRENRLAILDVCDFQPTLYRQIFYHKNKWKTQEMDRFIELANSNLF